MSERESLLRRGRAAGWLLGALALWATAGFAADRVLDDFSSAVRFGWNDFILGPGSITQTNGQLAFDIPAAVQEPSFAATARVTEWFQLTNSPPLEFRVDVVGLDGLDSFAVLGWVPESEPVTAFAGYFVARSAQELRIGKAINKYFYRAPLPSGLTNQNVTLVLALSQTNGSVLIKAQVLDLENGEEVLFDQTFLDTPAADSLQGGTDDPPAPYSGRGRFVLMEYVEYQPGGPDPRELAFANAAVSPPAPPRLSPVMHDTSLTNNASFVDPTLLNFNFLATSDQDWEQTNDFFVGALPAPGLGGVAFGPFNPPDYKTIFSDLLLTLEPNSQYDWTLLAWYMPGVSNTMAFSFDTFSPSNVVIEAEDYNFNGGQFLDHPALIADGTGPVTNAYAGQSGVPGVDFYSPGPSPGARYRQDGGIGTKASLDYVRQKFVDAGGAAAGIYDYDVFGLKAGDYLNYTRTFPTNYYEVYLRESVVNITQSIAGLELVTSDRSLPNQTTQALGQFQAPGSDFVLRNVPLAVAGTTNRIALLLGGVQTLRLRQLSALPGDAGAALNYLVFVPVTNGVVLESAAAVNGPYAPELAAALDAATSTIQVTRPTAATRFYRLRAQSRLRITSFEFSPADTVTLTFAPVGN